MYWELTAIFNYNMLKIRMRADIFGTEKCKVTFGLKYIFASCLENLQQLRPLCACNKKALKPKQRHSLL